METKLSKTIRNWFAGMTIVFFLEFWWNDWNGVLFWFTLLSFLTFIIFHIEYKKNRAEEIINEII